MDIKVIGIDLAKTNFQICAMSKDGKILFNKQIKRPKLVETIVNFPDGTLIAMEACASSHHWGRKFIALGYQVKLIPAQQVKAFCSHQKNDANDAVAICEAAFRPRIREVCVKTLEQQDIKMIRTIRQRHVESRTAIANQIRGLAGEYGVVFDKQIARLRAQLPLALEDAQNGFSYTARLQISHMFHELKAHDEQIQRLENDLQALCKNHQASDQYQLLLGIPGIGPMLAAGILSEWGDGRQFRNGREASAWVGLVPRQCSSGGKSRNLSITKNGNRSLRALFVHGARAVVTLWARKRSGAMALWIKRLLERCGQTKGKAIVAMANKLARIAWRVLSQGEGFDERKAALAI